MGWDDLDRREQLNIDCDTIAKTFLMAIIAADMPKPVWESFHG